MSERVGSLHQFSKDTFSDNFITPDNLDHICKKYINVEMKAR